MDNSISQLPHKRCTRCNEVKPVSEFSPKGHYRTYHSWCKRCIAAYHRAKYIPRPKVDRFPESRPLPPPPGSWLKICEKCGKRRQRASFADQSATVCKFCLRQQEQEDLQLLRNEKRLQENVQPPPLSPRNEKQLRYQRGKSLRHNYNMTIDEYDMLFLTQMGVCAICGNGMPQGKILCVDHDHKTGAIRGLLCPHCNHMLGYARDNISVLKRAIRYLQKYEQKITRRS